MVLMNLFAGQQWRKRHREQTYGRGGWAPQSDPTLCDPMDCSMPGLPVYHQFPEFTQTHHSV